MISKNKLLEVLKFSKETDKGDKMCLFCKLQTKFVVSLYLHYPFYLSSQKTVNQNRIGKDPVCGL